MSNFSVLGQHDEQLLRLGMLAEKYFADDPNTCLIKLRQLTEALAQLLAARSGLFLTAEESQYDLLRRLRDSGVLPNEIYQIFGEVRRTGNDAAHALSGDRRTALAMLKLSWQLGLWYHRTFKDPHFKSGPFIPPQAPADKSEELQADLAKLAAELEAYRAANTQAAEKLSSLEADLCESKDEQAFWESVAAEEEGQKVKLAARLAELQLVAKEKAAETLVSVKKAAASAVSSLHLDEAETRKLIDDQLRQASWEADTNALKYGKGIRPNDVLMTIVGTIGRTAVVQDSHPPFALQRSVAVLRASSLYAPYLSYALEAPLIQKVLNESAQGTAQKGVYLKTLGGIEIPLAPLPEQKRIADKLDSTLARAEACRERIDRLPALLKRFRQSILAAATSGRLTEDWRADDAVQNWPLVSLGTVATGFSYGSAAKSAKAGSVLVLRMGNIQDGCLDWTDLVFTSNEDEIKKYRLEPGDVLFNRTNSPELVGKTAVFKGEREAVYAGYLIRVKCSPKLLPDYLNYCFGSPEGRDYCWQVKSDGVSQSNINAKKLAAFEFMLPPIDEQHEVVRRVETLFAFADRLESRLATARKQAELLSPALLAKAFRGELVPQDPNDEPASELLKRLATTRSEVPKAKRVKANKGA